MRLIRFRIALLAGACVLAGLRPVAAQPAPPAAPASCDAAGTEAEQKHDLPVGLLRAIGRIESGRRDPATGLVSPWPWTINAEGRGKLFDSQAEALSATRTLQGGGVASIDVGCFQVNLVHHPLAFASLEDGFDPRANADYAARFLKSLRAKAGDWEGAVAAYHSAMPERGLPYRDRVLASWSRDGGPGPASLPLPRPAPLPLVVRMVTWTPPAATRPGAPAPAGMKIWTPSAPGQGAAVIRITRG